MPCGQQVAIFIKSLSTGCASIEWNIKYPVRGKEIDKWKELRYIMHIAVAELQKGFYQVNRLVNSTMIILTGKMLYKQVV